LAPELKDRVDKNSSTIIRGIGRKLRCYILRNEELLVKQYKSGIPKYARNLEAIALAKSSWTIYNRRIENETKEERDQSLKEYDEITNPLALLCDRYNKNAI
jgi:hypothetical protein